jgi:hypothetical protein
MRTRERVLLATVAVAGLTILTGATASAAMTIGGSMSTQSAGTFAVVPNRTTIRLAVHTTALASETSSTTATAVTSPEVVDAPSSDSAVTSTGPTKADHTATSETTYNRAKSQVSTDSAILANGPAGRLTPDRTRATRSGLEVSAAVSGPANRGGVSPSSSVNPRTATSGAVARC